MCFDYPVVLPYRIIAISIYDIRKHFVIIVCSLEEISSSNRPCCDPYISASACRIPGGYLDNAAPLLIQC